ncbi:MAG: molybdopterin cofactor-binding domain-containing protein [Isosphaeraceae bacterium]
MNPHEPVELDQDIAIEPERYEFFESAWGPELARRDFLRVLGGGLLILYLAPDQPAEAQESGGGRRRNSGGQLPREIGAWLHIGEDGAVTGSTGKVEVGQNARTSLTMAVADELNLPLSSVRMVMGDTDHVPFDIGTFGSLTTPRMVPQMRRAAAAARAVLLKLAAEEWGVDRGTLATADGQVTHPPSGRSAGFGELTRGRRLVETIGDDTPTMPPAEWKAAGKSVPKIDARALVTGKHRFPSDLTRPGMLRGKVLRPPSFGARLASLDGSGRGDARREGRPRRRLVGVVAPASSPRQLPSGRRFLSRVGARPGRLRPRARGLPPRPPGGRHA